ncbi:hypothetical protein BRARA_B02152 [Brassica rapa]|uniref:Uncharacterized protein n=1 Tax=Brassica campestris TaxID=3711 RepID=A0A398AIK4_BRACM|nr:hypothetical protein BRARA_B02152 [Brassica rapa]
MFGGGWIESNTYFSTHGFLQNNHRLKIDYGYGYERTIGLQSLLRQKAMNWL